MIPWKLWFSGIRDYVNTTMDLSGQQEHVLITGPNGAGKSTITYCMGAVLYSSKVELDGLKSRNLLPDETWKAHIRLLFKNDGLMRIDAPDYVEFALHIVQEPGQPVKREYSISAGDYPDEWEHTTRFTSGDRQYNFTAYKNDLQYKYKLDPDLFYLIWYQQEVNQFAVMHPEERFRIFAEMHGIDRVQRNWEESMERQKETQEALRQADINVKSKKQLRNMKQTELDRYEDNRRRLLEGGRQYARALLQLEVHYKQEQDELGRHIEQLELEIERQQELINKEKEQEEAAQGELQIVQQQLKEWNHTLAQYDTELRTLGSEIQVTKEAIAELERELADISKEKARIIRTEEEVKQQLAEVTDNLLEASAQQIKLQKELGHNEKQCDDLRMSISRLEAVIEQDRNQDTVHAEWLRQYSSSHCVQERINQLEQSLSVAKDQRHEYGRRLHPLKEELVRLEDERDWSNRQIDSLGYFSANGMKAYALRELIELDDTAEWREEEQFNAIKYTVFFDGVMASPPNDLYHVPLRKVVPERSVTEIPELKLRVKEKLSEEVIPHAMKALWWVGQLFRDGAVRIERGLLVDNLGIRGPQEQQRYILSMRALLARKEEVKRSIQQINRTIEELDASIDQDTKSLQQLNGIIRLVREAEAFRTSEHERESRVRKLAEEKDNLDHVLEASRRLNQAMRELAYRQIEMEHVKKELQAEADFYVRLGEQKLKLKALTEKQQHLRSLKEKQAELRHVLERGEEELEACEASQRKLDRGLQDLQYKLEQAERELQRMRKQRQDKEDDLGAVQGKLIEVIHEIEDLKQLPLAVYDDAVAEIQAEKTDDSMQMGKIGISLHQVLDNREKGYITFTNARNEKGIDPAAPENFRVVDEEYQRLEDEYKRTMILFEQDQERALELKNALETTINMRVLEIRQRFALYMNLFQFEGEIDWDQAEDRHGRTHFYLYIKARKEGHRGTMEDVSVKARGGRVGKGVSGGEESLTSLLFALALLQNLESAPDFIVLDEFDSALDELRKLKVFDLYASELERKLIILTPKSQESAYLDRFAKAYIVHHDPTVPRSKVAGIVKV